MVRYRPDVARTVEPEDRGMISSERLRRRVRFRTATGSVYELVETAAGMSWRRLSSTLASGRLRTAGAPLLVWPDVRVGAGVPLISPPIVPDTVRIVETSEVVEIIAIEGEDALGPIERTFPPEGR